MEYKVLNNRLMAVRSPKEGYWHIEANIFETAKAYCIWDAKESAGQYIPRFVPHINEDAMPDLARWRLAFSSDNSPGKVSFRGRDRELAEALKDVDFSKPYDDAMADSIRAKFLVGASKKPEVDADLIIQGELGELEDKT